MENIFFRGSVLPWKMSGMTKHSSDISSSRLFCSGVPVSSSRRSACTPPPHPLFTVYSQCCTPPPRPPFCSHWCTSHPPHPTPYSVSQPPPPPPQPFTVNTIQHYIKPPLQSILHITSHPLLQSILHITSHPLYRFI